MFIQEGREAPANVIHGRMEARLGAHLESCRQRGVEDRLILTCFLLALSTRKAGKALLPLLGETVSASTVSNVAKQLDDEVAAWRRRKLSDSYRVLMFDGVVLKRKTGAGSIRRPVLVALGIRPDGRHGGIGLFHLGQCGKGQQHRRQYHRHEKGEELDRDQN